MSLLPERSPVIKLTVNAVEPELLSWLEEGIQLGLISEHQVNTVCRQYLVCGLPTIALSPIETLTTAPKAMPPAKELTTSAKPVAANFRPIAPAKPTPAKPAAPAKPVVPNRPNPVGTLLHSLMAELSVRWLLFLGVFMVVGSSGVLAASQWQRFPAAGQYGILLAYTSIFWGASLWVQQQASLRLTAQTLRLVTLLLVPVNFWAMDRFGLWSHPLNCLVIVIAAGLLTFMTHTLFNIQTQSRDRGAILPFLNHLGLSYLHWGWALTGFPLVAVYLGTISTTLVTLNQFQQPSPMGNQARTTSATPTQSAPNYTQQTILVSYALLILLGRATFVSGVDVTQLGLALGLCGWLVTRYPHAKPSATSLISPVWAEVLGGCLLGLGWLLSVGQIPGQAIVVSGLAGWFFWRRLVRSWQTIDLLAVLLIGLQSFWLGWRLIPAEAQRLVLQLLTQWTQAQDAPYALLSLVWLPYLGILMSLTAWFYRQRQPHLARFNEGWTLTLGIGALSLSVVNPLLRTIALVASTIALALTTRHYFSSTAQPTNSQSLQIKAEPVFNDVNVLVYLTHSMALLTIVSGIHYARPDLSEASWSVLLLLLMLVEFATYRFNPSRWFPRQGRVWCNSFWHLGLVLAGMSYLLVASAYSTEVRFIGGGGEFRWSLVWLVVPLALTGLASDARSSRSTQATQLSMIALCLAQVLTLGLTETRIIGLAIATGLMLINTQRLQDVAAATLTIAFGLGFVGVALWEGKLAIQPTLEGWLIAGAIVTSSFWLLRSWLIRRAAPLRQVYAQALDAWAIVLCAAELCGLIAVSIETYGTVPPTIVLLVTTTVTMLASAYRSWVPTRHPTAMWGSVAVLGVAQIALVGFPRTRLVGLAIAIVLMLIHTRFLQRRAAAAITVGFGLSFITLLLWEGVPGVVQLQGEDWFVVGAALTAALWGFWDILRRRTDSLSPIYAEVVNGWAIVLASLEFACLTIHSIGLYERVFIPTFLIFSPSLKAVLATGLLMVALLYRGWRKPSNWVIYSLGWGMEILSAEVLSFTGQSIVSLAVANVALGLIIQLVTTLWQRRNQTNPIYADLQLMSLLYGILGATLRWGVFTNWSALTSLGVSLIAIGLGREKRSLKPLVHLGMAGITFSAYECLLYQMAQAQGGAIGDGVILMAGLGTSILYAYRVLHPWLKPYLHLSDEELKIAAHAHWFWSSGLLLLASLLPIDASLLVGLGVGAFLVRYAIFQGRNHAKAHLGEIWVYLGLLETVGIRLYWLSTPIGQLLTGSLVMWKPAVASVFALAVYLLPWQRWGWQKRPWLVAAFCMPLIALVESQGSFNPLSLFVAAGFYGFLAWDTRQIRFTYLSAALVDWAVWRSLVTLGLTHSLWYASIVGFSLLYVIQVEPSLKAAEQKINRHTLRMLATGLICGMALLQQPGHGLVPGMISLVAIAAGLGFRVRAFLYVGTATFLLNGFYQLVVLIFDYPFIKWVIGLCVGTTFIWIAATFETRRDQISGFVRHWLAQLKEWE